MFQNCPYDTEFLPNPEFVGLIITVPKAPWWYLTPTPIVFGKWGGVLLQNPYTVLPVLAVKWFCGSFQVREGPGNPGKRHGH